MDLQERHQLEAARHQMAKVRARTRPWRYVFALVLAVVAAAVSVQARYAAGLKPQDIGNAGALARLDHTGNLGLSYGTAVAFCLLAGIGTIGLGNKTREVLERSVGTSHAAVVRFAVLVIGGLSTIVVTLQLLNIAVTQLVVGGALTGVLVGIAAQQSLANVFAGIVLLMARPFRVGDQVGIRSGALSGLLEGTVSEVSITYVTLATANGPIHVPNSQVLAAAVGPAGALPPPAGAGPAPADAAASPAQPGAPDGTGMTAAGPAAAALGGDSAEAQAPAQADQAQKIQAQDAEAQPAQLQEAKAQAGPLPAEAQPPQAQPDGRETGGQPS
ncbi:MAG TPA: mechanosensitive ion channel domain-containing protein [Streptosporangiaceae bacterium]|nr:mechanosensitive ion channel domain-containing protein [Streptosporangiaceae bacterium]